MKHSSRPSSADKETEALERSATRKLNNHLIPIFFGMTLLCWLDRTSLAFAALQLNEDLGFSEAIYGLGASVFFVSYSLCQVPSNMILVRVGAPTWLSVIVVAWGLVAMSFATMKTKAHFYILRLLLGVAEAGSFPGMWYHLSLFFEERDLALAYAYVTLGSAVSQIIGGPLAAALLSLDGWCGLQGWQWLFLCEGVPTVVLGLWMRGSLVAHPSKATFLTPDERDVVVQRMARSKEVPKTVLMTGDASDRPSLRAGLRVSVGDWRVWYLSLVAVMEATAKYSIVFWAPLLISHMLTPSAAPREVRRKLLGSLGTPSWLLPGQPTGRRRLAEGGVVQPVEGISGVLIALLSSVPFGTAAAAMVIVARRSAAVGEKRLHAAVPLGIAALALGAMGFWLESAPSLAFCMLLAATSLWGPAGILSSLPASFLHGPAAATGVALINSVANLGGMIGPSMIGAIKHHTESYTAAILLLACTASVACGLVYFMPLPGFAVPAVQGGKGPVRPSSSKHAAGSNSTPGDGKHADV